MEWLLVSTPDPTRFGSMKTPLEPMSHLNQPRWMMVPTAHLTSPLSLASPLFSTSRSPPPSMAAVGDDADSSSAAVTVATPPPYAAVHHPSNDSDDKNPADRVLTLALPIQQPPPPSKSPSPAPAARVGPPIREDCWSEGATSVLIDAWGERYLHLNRGNLRRSDWQEVADAVSSREDYTKPSKSDAQCKNRIDTLKKKYKQEISKRSNSGSSWIFFDRLHHLLGGNPNPPAPKPSNNRIRLPVKRTPQPQAKSPSPPPSEDESSEGFPPPPPPTASAAQQRKRGRGGEIGEIMRAVMRFAEIYEKAEKEKMEAEAEVEKRRLEFEKEIEVQRVQFFLRAQMEIDRIVSGDGGRRRDGGSGQWGRRLAGGGRGNTGTSNNDNNVMSDDSSQ